jgi:hypothetical protein
MLPFPEAGDLDRIPPPEDWAGRSRAAIPDRIATSFHSGMARSRFMRPTVEEIRRAAYDRWERRGWSHGDDRDDWYAAEMDLAFHAHYQTIAEYTLEGPEPRVLGDATVRRCRFCERTARPADFGPPSPVVVGRPALLTVEVCEDCQSDWRDGLDDHVRAFWSRLQGDVLPISGARSPFSVGAFKAMAAVAVLILPATELRFFGDTIEWASNPDHDSDDQLLEGAECRVYRAPFLGEPALATLARRVDDEAAVPYMLCSLESGGIMVQVPVPMCLRDEDLDGRPIEHPERIPVAGRGPDFREARSVLLPLSVSERRRRRTFRHPAVA